MKFFKSMLLLCFIVSSLLSCNNEELFIEPTSEVVIETDNPADNDTPVEDTNAGTTDTSAPCDFTLVDVQSGDTVGIDCMMDLGGQTISLPSNVTIVYEGGDIVNGTLTFSDNTVISGELLNPSLTLSGSTPLMKDTTFNFDPQRWGIVEGVVTDEVANSNSDIINQTIRVVKELGVETLVIDEMDAYLGLDATDYHYGILMPSNFNLKMTENTNLRVQPNGYPEYSLIYCWREENITISGGKLWGDRYTHDYTTVSSTHEWGHIIRFKGVHNGVVDNVEMHEGSGDGFEVFGVSDRNADGSLKPDKWESFNVTVKNCLINDNRRQNITIADGTNIFIEYNTIRNGGSGVSSTGIISSNGISPRCGLVVEHREKKAPDGNSIYEWEKTDNVHIRNNIFEDNYNADIALVSGENTFIYNNTFTGENAIGTTGSSKCKIYDNLFENSESDEGGYTTNSRAIQLKVVLWENGEYRLFGFEVTGNTFIGYHTAVNVGGQGHKIKNNTITNCKTGFSISNSKDLVLDNNIITSNIDNSKAYVTYSEETSIINCLITNGETNVKDKQLYFLNKNNNEEGDITIDNVAFNGVISLRNVQNVTVKNSSFTDISITDCTPTLINNN